MTRWRQQFITYTTVLMVTFALLECLSFALFKTVTGRPFDYATLNKTRADRLASLQHSFQPDEDPNLLYQFHPYVGYVGRPGARPWGPSKPPFNTYGMLTVANHPYPYKKQPQDFAIAVLGGSVADTFSNLGQEALSQWLREEWPTFDKHVVLINLATGGFKQPQQLFHLEYALLSGFEFDLVLNVDGFNELALASENIRQGINPIFPSGHHMGLMSRMSETIPGSQLVWELSQYYTLLKNERRLLSFLSKSPFRYSVFLNLVGDRWTTRSQNQLKNLEYQMAGRPQQATATMEPHNGVADSKQKTASQQGLTPAFLGPRLENVTAENGYVVAANVWRQSSRMLHAVCQTYGIPYIHVLQPNQYVEGSKRLTDKEKTVMINPKNPWGIHVKEGYKYLVALGDRLKQDGIAFHDFTMIFKDYTEDLYIDDCCHFGQAGVEIMAKQVAHILLPHLKMISPRRSPGQA